MALRRHFTEHPASVGESYFEHMRVAAHFAKELSKAASACALHAVFPSMCVTSGSDTIKRLHVEVTSGARGAASAPTQIDQVPQV